MEAGDCLYQMSHGIIAGTLCYRDFYVGSIYPNHSTKSFKCMSTSFQTSVSLPNIPNQKESPVDEHFQMKIFCSFKYCFMWLFPLTRCIFIY